MPISIGLRVRITNKDRSFYGFVGKVIEIDYLDECTIELNNGERTFIEKEHLQEVEPSFQNLLVGDVIVSQHNDETKVLEVGRNSFLIKNWDDFDEANSWITFKQAKIFNWKVKGQKDQLKPATMPVMENMKTLVDDFIKTADVFVEKLKTAKE